MATIKMNFIPTYISWAGSAVCPRQNVLAPDNHRVVYITMTSLVAILDLKGKPLIQRSYRDDVPSSCIERFLPLVLEIEEDGQQVTPCFSNQGVNYMHIRHSNLYRE
jgi:hypothetical protein